MPTVNKLLIGLMSIGLVACNSSPSKEIIPVKQPPQEIYLEAIAKGDLDSIKRLEELNSKSRFTTFDKKTLKPIYEAAKNNQPLLIPYFVSMGYEQNKGDSWATPLMKAVQLSYIDVVRVLIEQGADVNLSTNDEGMPLSVLNEGDVNIAKLLMDAGANPLLEDYRGKNVLWKLRNKPIILSFLTKKLEEKERQLEEKERPKKELFLAFKNGDMNKVQAYMDKKYPLNVVDENGVSLVAQAVLAKQYDVLKQLLDEKAPHSIKDKIGWTPLMEAANLGYQKEVSLLLAYGANPNDRDSKGWTALHLTVNGDKESNNDFPQIAELLIKHKADINARTNSKNTPLSLAVSNNKLKTLKVLLHYKANVDVQDNSGWTPLMTAVNNGNEKLVKILLESGANPNLYSTNEWNALHLTVNNSNDFASIAKLLIKNGAVVNARNDNYQTALWLAVNNNKKNVFKVLVKAKANLDIEDKNGISPLVRASLDKNKTMIVALIKAGVDTTIVRKIDVIAKLQNLVNDQFINAYYLLMKQKSQSRNEFSEMMRRNGGSSVSGSNYSYSYQQAINDLNAHFKILKGFTTSKRDVKSSFQELYNVSRYREANASQFQKLLLDNKNLLLSN